MEDQKIVDLIDECINFIDQSSGSTRGTNDVSSLNVRVNPGNHRSSMITPAGLRSTAPEPPSPSAYAYDPNIKPISEDQPNSFPSQFPTSNTTTPKPKKAQNDTANTDSDTDLDSDNDENENEPKKLTGTERLILEEESREKHLQPIYSTLCIDSRPFGIALCKKFDENYLCVALPESPSGQLGLRTGSQILGIDQFIIDSMNYSLCNVKFATFAHSWFYMMGFDKVNWLTSHLPINFFLKYDPLQVLAEGTKKRDKNEKVEHASGDKDEMCKDGKNKNEESDKSESKEEECDFWRQMQDDIYRWAIDKQAEYWKIVSTSNSAGVEVMTMPPIESKGVQTRLGQRYKYLKDKDVKKRKPDWEKRNGRQPSDGDKDGDKDGENSAKSAFSADVLDQEIIQVDDEYKCLGHLAVGTTVGVFAKAGAWLEIREPFAGWIKFYDAKSNATYLKKCNESEQQKQRAQENKNSKNKNSDEGSENNNNKSRNSVRKLNLFDKIVSHHDDTNGVSGVVSDFLCNENGDFTLKIQTSYLTKFKEMAYNLEPVIEDKKKTETEDKNEKPKANDTQTKENENENENDSNKDDNINVGGDDTDEKTEENAKDMKIESQKEDKKSEEEITDGLYWLSDIIMNPHSDLAKNRQSVIYFMGDLDFGYTLKTIDSHLHKLQSLQRRIGNDTVNWIVVRVCSVNGTMSSGAVAPMTFKTEDNITHNLCGFVVARVTINVLKLYGLNEYDTGFFKFGLLMTESNGDILIHPTQNAQGAIESIADKIR